MNSAFTQRNQQVTTYCYVIQDVAQEVKKNEQAAVIAAQSAQEKKQKDEELWREWLGSYQQRLDREVASGATWEQHVAMMNAASPKIVLRNWVALVAIDAASKGDYGTVRFVCTPISLVHI